MKVWYTKRILYIFFTGKKVFKIFSFPPSRVSKASIEPTVPGQEKRSGKRNREGERETSFCENDGGGEGGGGFPHIPAMFDKSGGGGSDWQAK